MAGILSQPRFSMSAWTPRWRMTMLLLIVAVPLCAASLRARWCAEGLMSSTQSLLLRKANSYPALPCTSSSFSLPDSSKSNSSLVTLLDIQRAELLTLKDMAPLFYISIYFAADPEWEKPREIFQSAGYSPKSPPVAVSGPHWNQEPWTASGSPIWLAVIQAERKEHWAKQVN